MDYKALPEKIIKIDEKLNELYELRYKIESLRRDARTILEDIIPRGKAVAVDKHAAIPEFPGETLEVAGSYKGIPTREHQTIFSVGRDETDVYAKVFETRLVDKPDKIETERKNMTTQVFNPEVLLMFVADFFAGIPEETVVKMRRLHNTILQLNGELFRKRHTAFPDLLHDLLPALDGCLASPYDGDPASMVVPFPDIETDASLWLYPHSADLNPTVRVSGWPYAIGKDPSSSGHFFTDYIWYLTLETGEDGETVTVKRRTEADNATFSEEDALRFARDVAAGKIGARKYFSEG